MTHNNIDSIAPDTSTSGQEFSGHYSNSSAVAALAISNLHLDSVAWAGVGNTVVMDAGGNAAVDGGPADWATGSLTVERSGAAVSTDVLGFNTAGASFTVSGNALQAGGLAFATFDLTGGKLTVSFTSSATQATTALVQDVMQHVTYRSDTPGGNATLQATLSHGVETATADVTVTSNTIYVTNATDTTTSDPSDGVSLSEALALAAGGGKTIVFASSLAGSTINLAADATVAGNTTFEVAGGSGTITVTGNELTFGGQLTATVGTGSQLVLNSKVNGNLQKTGAGTLELGGAANGTGTIDVSAGQLTAKNGSAIADTSAVTLSAGATLTVAGNEAIGSLAGSGSVSLGAGTNLSVGDSSSTTFSGDITGSGDLTKTGTGTLSLSTGNNSFTGGLNILAGNLAISGGNSIGDTSAVTVAANATLSVTGGSETIGSLSGAGAVSLGYTLNTGGNNTSTTFSGVISGTGNGIVKTGTGTLTLSGANTYTGSTTVSGGTLALQNGSAIADTSAVTVNASGTLSLAGAETVGALAGAGAVNLGIYNLTAGGSTSTTFSGALAGTGQLFKLGSGSLTLSGNSSTYGGIISVASGTLIAGSNNALGTTAGGTTVSSGATLQVASGVTVADALNLAGAGAGSLGALVFAGPSGTVSGNIALTAATTFSVVDSGLVSGVISGTSALTKVGAGVLTFTGNNTNSAAVNVTAGTLVLGGKQLGTGTIHVSSGATLTGSGQVNGEISVNSGGTLAPGATAGGIGKFTLGSNLTLSAGSTLVMDINGSTPGTQYDQIAAEGSIDVTGATLVATLGYTPAAGQVLVLIDNTDSGSINGNFAGLAEAGAFTPGGSGTPLKASYTVNGNDFALSVPPAPTVLSIVRAGTSSTTNASSVSYTVTFSEAVTGVDSTDFALTGLQGTIAPVTGTGDTYTVTVTGITGDGTQRLDLKSSATGIASTAASQAIAAGGYTAGQVYTLDHTPPTTAITAIQFGTDTGGFANDLVTSAEGQIVSVTFSHEPLSDEVLQIQLSDGGTWLDANAAEGSELGYTAYLPTGENTIKARVHDAAGNTGPEFSRTYVVDDTAPAFSSASVTGDKLTVQYTDDLLGLDAAHPPSTSAFTVIAGGLPVPVIAVVVSSAAKTATLTLAAPVASGTVVTVGYTDPSGGDDTSAIQDTAGNDAASFTAAAVANNAPPPASDPGPATPPPTTVDGVPLTTSPGANGATLTTIPVVLPTRTDAAGSPNPTLADIPLFKDASGQTLLQVGVPTGMGLTAEGLPTTVTGSAALAELALRIAGVAGADSDLGLQGQAFLASLGTSTPLAVQTITPKVDAGFNPGIPLVITGGSGNQAVVIDARNLPSGTVIQVDNVEFVAIVGAVRIIGGAGQNAASGDGAAQWIVLGPDDDIIHGGGGNDIVGSEGGDDQVYGDAGDDIVFGGAGNDLLSGGTGSDRLNGGTGFDVAIQEGARSDYTFTLDGAGIKLTHTASGVSDWLVDVEQVRFATGPSLTVAHSAAEEAGAYLFQKWIGRDLGQGEGAIIQTLTGKTALEVATLFAQFFPQQSAGKTPAQLLEGMAAAGAIRVDAVRDVIVNGDAGNNTITPTLGLARYVDGGAGIDTVVIPATLAQTHVQSNNGSFTLQRLTDGAMLDVTRVERITFNDTRLALDLNGHAGEAAKLLGALGGTAALANKGLVGEVIRALDAGATSQTLAGLGLQALGANTPTQVAQTLWTNVVGRAGTDSELKVLTDIMAGGTSAADLVVMAAHLDATATRIDLVGLAAKGIEFA